MPGGTCDRRDDSYNPGGSAFPLRSDPEGHEVKVPPYNLRYWPDEILTRPMPRYTSFGLSAKELARTLIAAMQRENGMGLAAPQVGIEARAFAFVHTAPQGMITADVLFNPEVMPTRDAKMVPMIEGCLSIPGWYFEVERPSHVTARGVDYYDKPFTFDAAGMLARCFLHEEDHLNGIMVLERLNKTQIQVAEEHKVIDRVNLAVAAGLNVGRVIKLDGTITTA